MSKLCRACGDTKALTEFSVNKATRDGLMNICKPCDNERRAARRKMKGGEAKPTRIISSTRGPLVPASSESSGAPRVIPARSLGPLRTLTEHEHITILARNIGTLAEELRDIADIAAQDGRTLNAESIFASNSFDVQLQALEYALTRLVEGAAARLGLVAA